MDKRPLHILIIDDNREDRAEIQSELLNGSLRQYQFCEAETGSDALRILKACASSAFDCVIMDYHLPDLDAPEILQAMGSFLDTICPVVVMTGIPTYKLGREVIDAGAQDLIGKSWINSESLTRAVENAIERHELLIKQKRMEAALKLNELRWRTLFDASTDAIGILGPNGFMECNQATLKMSGCNNVQEFLAKNPMDFSPLVQPDGSDSRILSEQHIATAFRQGNHRFEWRHRRLDGSEFDVDIVLTRIDLPEGPVLQAISRDITERKQAEKALQESQLQLSLALKAANAGCWESVPSTGAFSASDKALEIHGLPSGTLLDHEKAMAPIHPEDRSSVEASLQKAIETDAPFHCEYRLLQADGTVHWILSNGELDKNKSPPRLVGLVQDISEQKWLQLALQRSEQRYRYLFESNRDGIAVINMDGRILEANRAFQDMLGYSLQELRSLTFEQFTPQRWHETERSIIREKLLVSGDTGEYEKEYIHKNGQVFPVSVRAWPLRDINDEVSEMCGIARDISERKNQQKQLEESESRFRVLFESSSNAIALLDRNGYLDCNFSCVKLFGCTTKQEFISKDIGYFFPPKQPGGSDSIDLIHQQIDEALRSGECCYECWCQRPDGTTFIAEMSLVCMELNGKVIIHCTTLDITQHKNLISALAKAKDQADRANQAKSMFLANMSHEIRTPINAIMGLTDLCLGETSNQRERNFLVKIQHSSEALLQLINDILDFSKIEAGKLDLNEEIFFVDAVLNKLDSVLRHKVMEKGLKLIFSPSIGLETAYLGDPNRLLQILINLVGNAIKFTEKGRIEILLTQESRRNDKVGLHFTVKDQGIGIAPETLARLFQPFVQGDSSTTRRYGGTGLGLALSKHLVELMGGRMWAESTLNIGSSFHFTVVVSVREHLKSESTPDRCQTLVTDELSRLKDKQILLAEDTLINQEVIRELLERSGLRVRVVCNGEEAVHALADSLPDAVLMDCQMPVMDGYEATRLLRLQEQCRELPIIALTANTMQGDREKCLKVGMNDFVSKPINMNELLTVLARWIKPLEEATSIGDSEVGQVESDMPNLPGIDCSFGLRMVGGQKSLYRKILKMFYGGGANPFQTELREAWQSKDWSNALLLAHRLKGESRTIGAVELGSLAENLELAVKSQDNAAVEISLELVEQELLTVLAGLAVMNRDHD